MIEALIFGIAFAGVMILVNFSMWEGNVFSFYFNWLEKQENVLTKPIGSCITCMNFWWGLWYLQYGFLNWFIFLGISTIIIVFYTILLFFLHKNNN